MAEELTQASEVVVGHIRYLVLSPFNAINLLYLAGRGTMGEETYKHVYGEANTGTITRAIRNGHYPQDQEGNNGIVEHLSSSEHLLMVSFDVGAFLNPCAGLLKYCIS